MKSNEKSYLWEQERKRAQTEDEAELKKEQEAIIRMQKKKEVISAEESISDDLWKLRDLLEKHVIDDLLIKKVMQEAELNHKDIEEIFEKIDEIEAIDSIDDYLPKDMRVSKEEYTAATHDDTELSRVEDKIHAALTHLSQSSAPQTGWSINLFTWFMTMLDKNLITIQEHHIDMKDSLNPWNKKTKNLWQTIKDWFTK